MSPSEALALVRRFHGSQGTVAILWDGRLVAYDGFGHVGIGETWPDVLAALWHARASEDSRTDEDRAALAGLLGTIRRAMRGLSCSTGTKPDAA
jgi:hypothetical protein